MLTNTHLRARNVTDLARWCDALVLNAAHRKALKTLKALKARRSCLDPGQMCRPEFIVIIIPTFSAHLSVLCPSFFIICLLT